MPGVGVSSRYRLYLATIFLNLAKLGVVADLEAGVVIEEVGVVGAGPGTRSLRMRNVSTVGGRKKRAVAKRRR